MMKKAKVKTSRSSRSASPRKASAKKKVKKISMSKAAAKKPARTSARSSSRDTSTSTIPTNISNGSSMERSRGDFPLSFASKNNSSEYPKDEQKSEEARRAEKVKSTLRRQQGSHGSRSW